MNPPAAGALTFRLLGPFEVLRDGDLDPAVVTRILVPSDGGRFRFGHALVRDAVVADISPLRQARLHQRAADAIASVYGSGRDHAEPIAAHRWAASSVDDPGAVVDAQLRAAAVARGRAAMTTAADLVDRAFEAAKAMPAGPAREQREVTAVETMFTIERSWLVMGRGELAGRSEAAARRLSGPVGQQLLLYLRFGTPTDEGVIDDAAPLVRDALDIAAAHPDNARSRLYAHYMAGANHWAAGRISRAGQHLAEARRAWEQIAPRRGDRQTWATSISLPLNVAGVSAITAALAGDGALVAELIGQLDEQAAVLDAPAASISAGLFTALALTIHGDVAGARRGAVRATEASGVIRVGHLSPAAAVIEAWSRPDAEAATAVADAATAMDEIDAGPTRIAATMLRGLLAELRWRTGEARGRTCSEPSPTWTSAASGSGCLSCCACRPSSPRRRIRPASSTKRRPWPTPRASLRSRRGPGQHGSGSPADRPTTHRAVRHLQNSAPCE